MVALEARKQRQSPWNWSYRELLAAWPAPDLSLRSPWTPNLLASLDRLIEEELIVLGHTSRSIQPESRKCVIFSSAFHSFSLFCVLGKQLNQVSLSLNLVDLVPPFTGCQQASLGLGECPNPPTLCPLSPAAGLPVVVGVLLHGGSSHIFESC